MSDYLERVRIAQYTSPSGKAYTLQFDAVERSVDKKVAVHEIPQSSDAVVQDLGQNSTRVPFACFFSGDDVDVEADAFWSALEESGAGLLSHPRWGDIPVQVLGWSQTEDLVGGIGRVDFKIDFIRVKPDFAFPVSTVDLKTSVQDTVDTALENATAEAASALEPEDAADVTKIRAFVQKFAADFEDTFSGILALSESIQAEAAEKLQTIIDTTDALIAEPQELYDSLRALEALPAKVETGVTNKLDAYQRQLAAIIVGIPDSLATTVTNVKTTLDNLGYSIRAATVGTFRTRGDANKAAETLDAIRETVNDYIEDCEDAVPDYQADREALVSLSEALATARDLILEGSYSLKTERRVTLKSERTPIDLIAEFYGVEISDHDAMLDDFIETNGLQGDEIIIVPAGREVVYYA